jgi:hypothetical protein
MITPSEILEKARRKYLDYLRLLLDNKPFERIVIRGDKSYSKSSLAEFEAEIKSIRSKSKELKGYGYTIEFQTVKTKYLGVQDLPTSIYFESVVDFLKFIEKEKEAQLFKINSDKILKEFPELFDWAFKFPNKVIDNHGEWENIIKVCLYFKKVPQPNLYIRELPIEVHTKFVEYNQTILKELLDILISDYVSKNENQFEKRFNLKYSETMVRFRVLDSKISQEYFSGFNDLAIPISQFKALKIPVKRVLVVENKTTLYTTLSLPKMDGTIAIFGSGFGVSNLKDIEWLSGTELLYWGDIDAQGFEILSQFRGYFPQVKSILMDEVTFDRFFENDSGTPTKVTTSLNLTEDEYLLYNQLKSNNWRLEQEKISLSWVKEVMGKVATF